MEHRARYRGVTLIEAVLFISIAMGIIVGGLQFYQQASTALRTEQTVRLATSLVAETHSLYRGSDIPAEAARARIDPTLVAAGAWWRPRCPVIPPRRSRRPGGAR